MYNPNTSAFTAQCGAASTRFKAFATIVLHGTFARAAAELGVSASTLSQTIRELETRLGVRLLNRSTRSLSLTDAGQRLHARFRPTMLEMEAAAADVMSLRDRPAGTVRIHIPSAPAAAYLEPVLGRFHTAYPDIVLDVTVEDTVPDIVGSGYDLGVRLGKSLEADMVAVKLGGEQRRASSSRPRTTSPATAPPRSPPTCSGIAASTGVSRAAPGCTSGTFSRTGGRSRSP